MFQELFWLIFSYLIGSFPNGYLIPKLLKGIDIRKVGKEKLSSSNIIHQVGILPGVFSFLIDMTKGTIAVYFAQLFHFSFVFVALSGIVALTGQMWPIFLKFWGGRGGATSFGVLLIIAPKMIGIVILILLISKLISKDKGGPIGMSLCYILAIILGFFPTLLNLEIIEAKIVIIFAIFSFILVHLQRLLGKPGSLRNIKDKKIIIYRLFLDRDSIKIV